MVFKKRFWPKKRVAKKFRKNKRTKSSSLVTKAQLYRAIHRNVETKMATNQYTYSLFNSGITTSADIIPVLQGMNTGTSQAEKIGAEVRPIKLVIKGYIVYAGDAYSDARMVGARLFCFQDKDTRAYMNNIFNYNLLDAGGSSSSFTGTPMNWILPHNSDQFTFYADKRFKLLKSYGLLNQTSPSSTTSMTSINSSMFHPFTIVLTKKQLPAVLKFDATNNGSYPVNFAPYLALGYCDLLNANPDTTATKIGMEFSATLYYEDA